MIFNKIKNVLGRFTRPSKIQATVLRRTEHRMRDKDIGRNALKVLKKLKDHGFDAHLVGGGVRDVLLGKHPKDFDIATNAKPEQVRKIFKNCRLIGRRFRLAHVYFGRDIIEVATFRRGHSVTSSKGQSRNGMIVRDNVFGTIEEDALRRDFTINALYYNYADNTLIDFCEGMQDLEQRVLRLIGVPKIRYTEDPVRMLRAARLAAKLNLSIESATEAAIYEYADLLQHISNARLFDESVKLFSTGHAKASFDHLQKYDLFKQLFPITAAFLKAHPDSQAHALIALALNNTDARIKADKSVNPAFIIAVFLWHPMLDRAAAWEEKGVPKYPAFDRAVSEILSEQCNSTAIPRRLTLVIREIWTLQSRLLQRHSKKSLALLSHPRFRAAYDFLMMRAEIGEVEADIANWWTEFQTVDHEQRIALINEQQQTHANRGNRNGRRGGRRRRR